MRLVGCTLLLALIVASPSFAQESTDAGDAQKWLVRMEQALGGEAAIDALRSLTVKATCSGPDGAFETEVTSFRPDWVWFRQTRGDDATEIWSAPERTWGMDAEGQAKDYSAGVRSFVRAHEFHVVIFELATRFTEHRIGEGIAIRDQPCVTLHMLDDLGKEATIYLSQETNLPVMLETNPDGAAGSVRIYYERWGTKAGVQLFQGFELTEGEDRSFRYDYHTIEPNVASAMLFVHPASTVHRDDQKALLSVLDEARRAHLETDATLLVSNLADELLEISSGVISRLARSEVEAHFERVFDGATYDLWDDATPPVIKLSADGSLAWVARRVAVRQFSLDASGTRNDVDFVSAYSSTYEKQGGSWKMTSVTSTFLPD